MAARCTVLILYMCFMTSASGQTSGDFLNESFPEGFLWGTATSSYQIEGGWNADGKGENNWDRFCHVGGNVENNDTGDIACDSYNLFADDIQLMKDMQVDFYRFSLSWARILPDGTDAEINEEGIDYYNRLIDSLLAEDIQPIVTLYHWDLPQALQDTGGWLNEELIQHFNYYARLCFERYGDRVKQWLTFNEPFVFTWLGYGVGVHAPGISEPAESPYRAAHTIIKAHAEAYHSYDEDFRPSQQGVISITLDSDWKHAMNESNPEDVAAAERAMQFKLGWFANPIFVNGDYPDIMKETVAEKSALQGYNQSRLPSFTEEEKARIVGTHDYFGLNHYTTQLITHEDRPIDEPSYENDQDVREHIDPSWPSSGSSWLYVVPYGIRSLLNFIKDRYDNPAIYITENGMSDRNSSMEDDHRIYYYKYYINEALKEIANKNSKFRNRFISYLFNDTKPLYIAQHYDGCNLRAYTAWSLLDNFEWAAGYNEKFGLHDVDFNDPLRKRTPKASAEYYAQIIQDNGFKPDVVVPSAASSIIPSLYIAHGLSFILAFSNLYA